MQGLHAAVQHFRKARDVGDLGHWKAASGEQPCRSAGGNKAHAALVEGTLLKLYAFDQFKSSQNGEANGGVESLEIAGVFWDMAVEENHHSTKLLELYAERFGNNSCSVTEEDILDMIEVPRLEDGDVFSSDPHNANSARERALQVALVAEQSARKFYSGIADQTTDPKLRRLYRELADFETDHVEFLERKVSQTAAGNDTTN